MHIENMPVFSMEWMLADVNTGDFYVIRNIGDFPISYICKENPDPQEEGILLMPDRQLFFRYVNADLYVKTNSIEALGLLAIELLED